MMVCEITWNGLELNEWNDLFSSIRRSNVLQSYDYARAICPMNHQRGAWGIIKIDGQRAGMVQMLEARFCGRLFHAFVIDRGPLWFEGYGGEDHFKAFLDEINRQFPKRIGRKRRIIPEIKDSPRVREVLSAAGFTSAHQETHKTIWMDLRADDETLLAGMKKNWRGALNKALASDLQIEFYDDTSHFGWLAKQYAQDRLEKGYNGPSIGLLQNLGKIMIPQKRFMIGRAVIGGEAVAGILILVHGQSATYQIGFNGPRGRGVNAHHALLWKACGALRNKGIYSFDLGGINDTDAKTVQQFKTGMGGEIFHAPGVFI